MLSVFDRIAADTDRANEIVKTSKPAIPRGGRKPRFWIPIEEMKPETVKRRQQIEQRRLRGVIRQVVEQLETGSSEVAVRNTLSAMDAQYAEAHRAQVEEIGGPPGRTWYLPHHAVYQQDQSKTKCRVVFDGSATFRGTSLNQCLETGPRL
ncbi:hypothetical protein T4D_3802 [Trichinella pseudospiralis]|uniref:Uncharacterized protein n=1 Tax=Trichinella pseudospiralis TaxID=6337 RepID=A0A0V1FRA9_TRIPS|nr:hypothetical protein T4D_3802 [Trichinella pseudospiralis]